MNTNVTRGAGEFIVTTTGMATEVGHISGHARAGERQGLAAHEAARQADEPDPRHLGHRAGDLDHPEHVARRVVQHRLPGGDRVRDRRDPHRAPRRRHGDPLDGDAEARPGERDHEASSLDGDARLDLGDQLRQDRDADAQPDDGGRADDPGPPLLDRRQRLLHGGPDQAGRRAERRRPRAIHAADDPRVRRRRPRRRDDRRPHRRRARRAGREGWARLVGDAGDVPANRRAAVRHGVQAHGDVPPAEGRVRPRRRPLLRQGRTRPGARPRLDDAQPRRPAPDRRRRRDARALRSGERTPGRAGPACARDGAQGLRPCDVRSERRPAPAPRRAHAARARRDRRPAATDGEGCDCERAFGRDPGADDHRRPRRHRGGDRGEARHQGPGDHGRRVRRDERRRAAGADRRDRRHRTGDAGAQGAPRRHAEDARGTSSR